MSLPVDGNRNAEPLDESVFEAVVERFEVAWRSGTRPEIGDFLPVDPAIRHKLLAELILIDWEYRLKAGDTVNDDEYRERYPELFEDSETLSGKLSQAAREFAQRRSGSTSKMPPASGLQPGTVLGNYTIVEPIGQGGMGQVFKATHKRLFRTVALKVLTPALQRDATALKRFQREAKAAGLLSHPNIVTAHDADEAAGYHFLVMEYISGQNLSACVRDHGPMSVAQAVNCVMQTARGLEFAHQKGIIHRDIKPSNLVLDETGTIKVLDLGLARIQSSDSQQVTLSELTSTGAVLNECPTEFRAWEWHCIKRRCHPEFLSFPVDGGTVSRAIFSPDGKRVAAAIQNPSGGKIAVYRVETGEVLANCRGHFGFDAVADLAWSPDGSRLISAGSSDRTARIWEAASAKTLLTLADHTGSVRCVAWSPLNDVIACGCNDKSIQLWNANTGSKLEALRGASDEVVRVAFSADGRYVSAAFDNLFHFSLGRDVRVWNTSDGSDVAVFNGHGFPAISLAFCPIGKQIASGGNDRTVRVWNVETGEQNHVLRGHRAFVESVAYSADGLRIASGDRHGNIRIWNSTTGQLLKHIPTGARIRSLEFSSDGRSLLFGGDMTIAVCATDVPETPVRFTDHTRPVNAVAVSPGGDYVASASRGPENLLRVWAAETGQELWQSKQGNGILSMDFSPDGKQLVTSGEERTVRIWDATSGTPHTTLAQSDIVRSIAYSPNGELIAAGTVRSWSQVEPASVRVWNAKSGGELESLTGHTNGIIGIAFSSDSLRLASFANDRTIRIWDMAELREVAQLPTKLSSAEVAFSAGGDVLISAGYGGIRAQETKSSVTRWAALGNEGGVNCMACTPDGRRVATGGDDCVIRLWDVETGRQVAVLDGFDARVASLAFSRDGRKLVAGSYDNTVRVWTAFSILTSKTPMSFGKESGPP